MHLYQLVTDACSYSNRALQDILLLFLLVRGLQGTCLHLDFDYFPYVKNVIGYMTWHELWYVR
jgi:hypothetical protein